MKQRCPWCGSDPDNVAYHDNLWGVPLYDDRALFEMLVLEGAQAGLSWITILRKWPGYRKAFAGFDPEKIARFDDRKVAELMNNPGIVRNRLKIKGAIESAQAFLRIMEEEGSFSEYLWSFVGGKPRQNRMKSLSAIPTRSEESDAMSKSLKKNGFKFVGTTICYAFMQAVGMVNDHLVDCFRYKEILVKGELA